MEGILPMLATTHKTRYQVIQATLDKFLHVPALVIILPVS